MQFDQLKRREFITLLGGAAATWPLAGYNNALSAPRGADSVKKPKEPAALRGPRRKAFENNRDRPEIVLNLGGREKDE